jgi:hypothetical protein
MREMVPLTWTGKSPPEKICLLCNSRLLTARELVTNAIKYGVLSLAIGSIVVEFDVEKASGTPTFSFTEGAREFAKHNTLDYESDGAEMRGSLPTKGNRGDDSLVKSVMGQ